MADGSTWRQHLLSYENQTGVKPEELKVEPLPDYLSDIFDSFVSLSSRRAWTDNGPSPITFEAIFARQLVLGSRFKAWELDAVLGLDSAYLKVWHEKHG